MSRATPSQAAQTEDVLPVDSSSITFVHVGQATKTTDSQGSMPDPAEVHILLADHTRPSSLSISPAIADTLPHHTCESVQKSEECPAPPNEREDLPPSRNELNFSVDSNTEKNLSLRHSSFSYLGTGVLDPFDTLPLYQDSQKKMLIHHCEWPIMRSSSVYVPQSFYSFDLMLPYTNLVAAPD
jgi:hypothetical protein